MVEATKAAYEKEPDEEKATAVLSALWDLGDYFYELRKLDDAETAYTDMQIFSEKCCSLYDDVYFNRAKSVSYIELGIIANAKGDLTTAEEYYQQEITIAKALAEETKMVEARRDLAISYNKLGNIAWANSDLTTAEEYYQQGFTIRKALAEETKTVESYEDLAISYYRLGFLLRSKEMLEKAIIIWENLSEQCSNGWKYENYILNAELMKGNC